jgi:hypothetical protein
MDLTFTILHGTYMEPALLCSAWTRVVANFRLFSKVQGRTEHWCAFLPDTTGPGVLTGTPIPPWHLDQRRLRCSAVTGSDFLTALTFQVALSLQEGRAQAGSSRLGGRKGPRRRSKHRTNLPGEAGCSFDQDEAGPQPDSCWTFLLGPSCQQGLGPIMSSGPVIFPGSCQASELYVPSSRGPPSSSEPWEPEVDPDLVDCVPGDSPTPESNFLHVPNYFPLGDLEAAGSLSSVGSCLPRASHPQNKEENSAIKT